MLTRIEGIADLTTTEGKIRNFSRICKLISVPCQSRQLIDLVKENRYCKRKNEAVIRRHLRLLKKLKIIKLQDSYYTLSNLGEVLYSIVRDLDDSCEELTLEEKIFYFRVLFGGPTLPQLSLLLYVISKSAKKSSYEVIADYYKVILNSRVKLGRLEYIRNALERYERTGEFPKSCANRFDTMRMWLLDLGLVRDLSLTEVGKSILHGLNPKGELPSDLSSFCFRASDRIYSLASFFLEGQLTDFNSESDDHWKSFVEAFKGGYRIFERPLKFSNLQAMKVWICIHFVTSNKIIIEEAEVEKLLPRLQKESVVKSIILGDDGRAAYIRII